MCELLRVGPILFVSVPWADRWVMAREMLIYREAGM